MGVVGGRRRDEERLRPVPELLLLRGGLEGLLSFGGARLKLPGKFLKRGERADSNLAAFPTERAPRLRATAFHVSEPSILRLKQPRPFSEQAGSGGLTRRDLWFWRQALTSRGRWGWKGEWVGKTE